MNGPAWSVDDCLRPFRTLLEAAAREGRETISCGAIEAVLKTITPRLLEIEREGRK